MDDDTNDTFPEMYEAIWNRDQIVALFTDLHAGAQVTQIKVRAKPAFAASTPDSVTLAEAYELLREDRASAIQINYEYDGKSWCDTLIVSDGQYRILRTTGYPT